MKSYDVISILSFLIRVSWLRNDSTKNIYPIY